MRAAEKLLARMIELVQTPESGWVPLTGTVGSTVRFTKTEPTPDYARSSERGAWSALWNQDSYDTHVFVTLVAGKVVLGTAPAPWVGRRDSDIPFWLAEAILADPALAFDDERCLKLKAARRAAR